MQNLNQFKQKLNVGVKLSAILHTKHNGQRDESGKLILFDYDFGVREVSIKQSNSFALKTTKTDGTITNSWCSYPKASECKFPDENTIEIYCEDFRQQNGQRDMIKTLTYKFI